MTFFEGKLSPAVLYPRSRTELNAYRIRPCETRAYTLRVLLRGVQALRLRAVARRVGEVARSVLASPEIGSIDINFGWPNVAADNVAIPSERPDATFAVYEIVSDTSRKFRLRTEDMALVLLGARR